jgi:two-component system sensor histidine kinase MprB
VSLRTRIAAVAGAAVAVTVLLAAVVVYASVRSNLRGEVERALVERVADPGPGRGGPRGDRDGFRPPPRGERFGGAAGLVQLVQPDGTVRSGQDTVIPVTAQARAISREGQGRITEDVDVEGVHLMVLTVGSPIGAVQVARPLTETDHVLGRLLAVLIAVGLAGIALAAMLGAFVARTALAPIARFTARTESIAGRPSALSERIDVVGRDELARLATSFNSTLDSLETAVESQRQLVADASHELRTPIASLRANIQTLEEAERLPAPELAALRADILLELDELTGLVGDVVELARGAKASDALDDVRLDDVVRSLVERAERRGDKAVKWVARLEPTIVRGEPDRIGRAVSNLLDNARKWSPEGSTVDVDMRDGTLTVRDRGPGFAEEDLPRVFERFYRSREARGMTGSGLGLAIVRQAAEAHGGWVEASNAADGGAVLRVRFGAGPEARPVTQQD